MLIFGGLGKTIKETAENNGHALKTMALTVNNDMFTIRQANESL